MVVTVAKSSKTVAALASMPCLNICHPQRKDIRPLTASEQRVHPISMTCTAEQGMSKGASGYIASIILARVAVEKSANSPSADRRSKAGAAMPMSPYKPDS